MDQELLKLLGSGGPQLILAAGYYPVYRLVRRLWTDRDNLSDKLLATLNQQFADADKRKELWDAQAKVTEGQTNAIKDLTREIAAARADIQKVRP